ncbi:MAG: radical SAM protein [Candidatus Omnitrophica bacterium]|nr:radical SAM protein [Candidatus Omnitrophota bacterium]
MKKIVLVNPPLTLEERYGTLAKGGTSLPPLGLTILAAVLRQNNIPVSILDAAVLGLGMEGTVSAILEEKPAYVGFTTVTVSINKAAKIAERIKNTNPEIKILIGGPHITAMPEETIKMFPMFDIGVVGEGEVTTVELLKLLEQNKDFSKLKGLVFRDGEHAINTGRAELLKDLDSLPMDALDLLPGFPHSYKSSVHKLGRLPTTSLITSRGCPYKCRFCDNSMFGTKVRAYSTKRLLEIVKYLQKQYGIKDIFFNDDNFIMLKSRLVEFCNAVIKEKIDLTWGCYGRIDNITDESLLLMMKQAGCWRISFGLESGSQDILDFYRKNETLAQMEKVIGWTRKVGIKSKGFFMMGNFMETEETLQQTIDFAKRIKLDDFHATFLTPLPGSEIYDMADQYGEFDRNWDKMSMWFPVFVPKGLKKETLESYRKKAFLEFYVRPSIILSYLTNIRTVSDIRKISNGISALIRSSVAKTKIL